jgi:hypothetical protein
VIVSTYLMHMDNIASITYTTTRVIALSTDDLFDPIGTRSLSLPVRPEESGEVSAKGHDQLELRSALFILLTREMVPGMSFSRYCSLPRRCKPHCWEVSAFLS